MAGVVVIRTFFWEPVREGRVRGLLNRVRGIGQGFGIGNAGDLYNKDLIRYLYGQAEQNVVSGGRRLLLVGSTVHKVEGGDIVCGVGLKNKDVPTPSGSRVMVRGVRGPITLRALRGAGYDVSDVRFMADPGLLANEVYSELRNARPVDGKCIFIPHYRDVSAYRDHCPAGVELVSPDCEPRALAASIASAEYVYSSSLHGIVFAHSLGRPCSLVADRGGESCVKYLDYFESLGLQWRDRVPIERAVRESLTEVVDGVPNTLDAFDFPSLRQLEELGIAVGGGQ
jgi:hypothetical protein